MPETPRSLPDFASWPSFPFHGDLQIKPLEAPVANEPARAGEDPNECTACAAPDEAYIYVNERWRVRAMDRPSGLPMVLILESRTHLDLGDLPNMLAAELGVMTVRLERAIRSLDGVARVHVNRWGDGSAHLHLWFLARPYGRLQLRGTFLSLWDDILPSIPESQWRENLALVAAWLAEFGGTPLAQPPRIDWKAPSSFVQDPELPASDDDGEPPTPSTPRTQSMPMSPEVAVPEAAVEAGTAKAADSPTVAAGGGISPAAATQPSSRTASSRTAAASAIPEGAANQSAPSAIASTQGQAAGSDAEPETAQRVVGQRSKVPTADAGRGKAG